MPSFAVPETPPLSCAVASVEGVARVTVSGEIDVATETLLDDALAIAEILGRGMIIDLSGVEFIGCCGAQLLLETERRVRARGDQFTLDGVSDVVVRLLCLMGIEDDFGLAAAQSQAERPDRRVRASR